MRVFYLVKLLVPKTSWKVDVWAVSSGRRLRLGTTTLHRWKARTVRRRKERQHLLAPTSSSTVFVSCLRWFRPFGTSTRRRALRDKNRGRDIARAVPRQGAGRAHPVLILDGSGKASVGKGMKHTRWRKPTLSQCKGVRPGDPLRRVIVAQASLYEPKDLRTHMKQSGSY